MFLPLAFVALIATVDSSSIVKRMTNAQLAEIKDHPYLVFLGNDDNVCSGAIISRYNVLTAAHCVVEDKNDLEIRAGSNFKNKGGSVHHLESVISHPNFSIDARNQRSVFDIAVVKVKESFDYDDTRQPIRLFDSGEKIKPLTEAKAAGWGMNERNWFPNQFSKHDFYIVNRESCNQTFKSWGGLTEGQICATNEDQKRKYICYGDSGSPLAVDNRLAGVTIYGGGCELPDSPAVYSEVAYFREWIDKYVTFDEIIETSENDVSEMNSTEKNIEENLVKNNTKNSEENKSEIDIVTKMAIENYIAETNN